MRANPTASQIQPADLLFENNPSPMFILDPNSGSFLDVNAAAIAHYGYSLEEFLSKTIFEIRPQEDVPELLEYIRSGRIRDPHHVWRNRKKDGSTIYVRVAGRDITFNSRHAILVLIHDVTDQVRLEERLKQSQKVEAIGRLAGGVAHDFNNLLTVISGNVAMLLEDITDPDLLSKVNDIQKAAGRASALTRQLLSFSRKSLLQQKILDPNTIVRNASDMITRLIGEDIQVQIRLSPTVTAVRVDPVELEQVLMNLAVNARDAMPSGGNLQIGTEVVRVDDDNKSYQLGLHPGQYVVLSVSDTGCGMHDEIKAHIFEPFFTTKPCGQGTGLGLSTVYGIVKQCGGSIDVESELGKGTVFRVYLPSASCVREIADAPEIQPKPGSETILVVEDEAVVRDITSEGLKRRGYHVLTAPDEGRAMEICAASPSPIHLLLADVIMPGVNGPQLAQSLKAFQPQMQVLFMSGYTDEALEGCGFPSNSVALINKPFTFNQLHRKVREILDATATA